jgi:hypothetical protein
MKHRVLNGMLIAVMGLMLAACNIRVTTDVNDDGSGTYGFEMAFNAEDQELLTSLEYTPEQFCQEMQDEGTLPEGATVTTEQRGDEAVCVMSQPFANIEELRALYNQDQGDGIDINTLELSGGKFVYDVDVVMEAEESETTPIDIEWQVTVPGTVGSNNADRVEGNTLTWVMVANEARNVRVESAVGGLSSDTLYYVIGVICSCLCCVALLGAAGGGVYWFTQKNKGAAA